MYVFPCLVFFIKVSGSYWNLVNSSTPYTEFHQYMKKMKASTWSYFYFVWQKFCRLDWFLCFFHGKMFSIRQLWHWSCHVNLVFSIWWMLCGLKQIKISKEKNLISKHEDLWRRLVKIGRVCSSVDKIEALYNGLKKKKRP